MWPRGVQFLFLLRPGVGRKESNWWWQRVGSGRASQRGRNKVKKLGVHNKDKQQQPGVKRCLDYKLFWCSSLRSPVWGPSKVKAGTRKGKCVSILLKKSPLLLLEPCFTGKDPEAPRRGDLLESQSYEGAQAETDHGLWTPWLGPFYMPTASSPNRARVRFAFHLDAHVHILQGSYKLSLLGEILLIWIAETWTQDLVKSLRFPCGWWINWHWEEVGKDW